MSVSLFKGWMGGRIPGAESSKYKGVNGVYVCVCMCVLIGKFLESERKKEGRKWEEKALNSLDMAGSHWQV